MEGAAAQVTPPPSNALTWWLLLGVGVVDVGKLLELGSE